MKWADALLMTKAEQWSYEDEYRCIDPHGSDLREFQKEQLTGVVFGCQMPVEDRAEVRDWVEAREMPMAIYQARIFPCPHYP